MYPDVLAEVSALEARAAEREVKPVRCDLCPDEGEQWLGPEWLCGRCYAAALQALEREVYHAHQ